MTCFSSDYHSVGNRLGNTRSAAARLKAAFRLAAGLLSGPLRAYLRSRSQKRAVAQFAAVDMHTLEDIGLLRTHLAALSVSEDNDNNPSAASPVAGCCASR